MIEGRAAGKGQRVAMYRRGDDEVLAEQEFLLLNRAAIEVIRPLD